MSRDRIDDDRSIIGKLTANDHDTIAWLQRIGFVEIGADGMWHPTALARRAIACQHEVDDRTGLRSVTCGEADRASGGIAEALTHMEGKYRYNTGVRTMREPPAAARVVRLYRKPYVASSRE